MTKFKTGNDAIKYNGVNASQIELFFGKELKSLRRITNDNSEVIAIEICTSQNVLRVNKNEWIVKRVERDEHAITETMFDKDYQKEKQAKCSHPDIGTDGGGDYCKICGKRF